MDEQFQKVIDLRINACMKALEKHGFTCYHAKDQAEVFALLDTLIQDHEHVSNGGSKTLKELGVMEYLIKRDVIFHSHRNPNAPQESEEEAMRAFFADTFLASANAITLEGEIINMDGKGNRVSAMIYGPKQVVLIVGYNKIVHDAEAAKIRIRELAAPANTIRLDKKTPCRVLGSCKDCLSKERICCSYVNLKYDRQDRIRIIFVDEELGY